MPIEFNMGDLSRDKNPDLSAVPAGEYEVKIFVAAEKIGKDGGGWAGRKFLSIGMDIVNGPMGVDIAHAQSVNTNLLLPNEALSADAKEYAKEVQKFRDFCEAFGASTDTFEREDVTLSGDKIYPDLKGLTAFASLVEKKDEEYGLRNEIRAWVGTRKISY